MSQTKVFRGVQTSVVREPHKLTGYYRGTPVASCERKNGALIVTLNTGGWKSATTKTRMNQFSYEYCGCAFQVSQRKGEWYVTVKGDETLWTTDTISFAI